MNRYARQAVLPELGTEGQERLRRGSVLCIGAGGLGSPALMYLAAAGVGRIGLVDDDTVDVSNLQRQVLFKESDQGKSKVAASADALSALNSECVIEPHPVRLSAANAEALIKKYDIVLDGTDNFASKFLINDACVKFGKPLVYGSILGFEAQVSVFWAGHGPCYRCLYPKAPASHIPNCAEAGVIGAMAGIAGTVQALEAIKMLLGLEWCKQKQLEPLLGKLWMLDARNMQTRILAIHKRHDCAVCSLETQQIVLGDESSACAAKQYIQDLSPEAAAGLVGKAIFIDVREQHELASGRIPHALQIPLGTLLNNEDSVRDIPSDSAIIVYCHQGLRSLTAASHLKSLGFTHIAHLAGGMMRWKGDLV